jgi:hypothetical protein
MVHITPGCNCPEWLFQASTVGPRVPAVFPEREGPILFGEWGPGQEPDELAHEQEQLEELQGSDQKQKPLLVSTTELLTGRRSVALKRKEQPL